MTHRHKGKLHPPHSQRSRSSDPGSMLDMLLAMDRAVMEVSMLIYNLSARDRFAMREQNQRLHDAIREHLPRLREKSAHDSDQG